MTGPARPGPVPEHALAALREGTERKRRENRQ